jgi:thioredoxin 1
MPEDGDMQMNDTPVNVTDAEFEQEVMQAPLPVIVDFWAPWCAPCKMVAPILEKLASEYAGELIIAKVNTDENPQWAHDLGVLGLPTMLFFKDGEIVHNQIGALPEPLLRRMTESFVKETLDAPVD